MDLFNYLNPAQNTTTTRRAWLKCLYNNIDISADIAGLIKSFNFTDYLSGSTDEISLSLRDPQNLWKDDWLPERGALLTISIVTQSWHGTDDAVTELPLGLFELDEPHYTGPPDTFEMKAVSVPDNAGLRGVDKSKAWDNAYISIIAKEIANNAGMKLYFTGTDQQLKRAEQSQESDLAFLLKLCSDHGLALKISNNQIIIINETDYENKAAVGTLTKGVNIIHYDLKAKTRDIYAACHVKYSNSSQKNAVIEYTFTAPGQKGKTLEVNEQVDTIAEAELLAKKKLREKNKDAQTMSLTVIGDAIYNAGNCFDLRGFAKFDAKYIVSKVTHHIDSSGYVCDLDMYKCLEGY